MEKAFIDGYRIIRQRECPFLRSRKKIEHNRKKRLLTIG